MRSSAGLLGGEDFVFDSGQKAWIRLKDHPAVQAGWRARQRFRPLDDQRTRWRVSQANALDFPAWAMMASRHSTAFRRATTSRFAGRRGARSATRHRRRHHIPIST